MNFMTGLVGLKAAADLTKALRDAAKSGSLKPDEFAGRIGEIYDYIIDSKASLVEMQEETQALKEQIRELADNRALEQSVRFHDGAYWRLLESGEELGPFCHACWDASRKLVRPSFERESAATAHLFCTLHLTTIHFKVPVTLWHTQK